MAERVLVIGGTRFIGRAITAELAAHGYELLLLHRGKWEPEGLPDVPHLHADRHDLEAVAGEIAAFAPDVVLDCIPIRRRDAEEVCEAITGEVRFVVLSSIDVYRAYGLLHAGRGGEPMPINERSPLRDERYPYRGQVEHLDDYDKIDVEETYATRETTVLRLPMVYGPHDYQRREWHVLRRVHGRRKQIPVGSGSWLATRGFVDDIAAGVRLAIATPEARGETFNLCESGTYAAGDWARLIVEAAGADIELVRVPDEKLPDDLEVLGLLPQHLVASSEKAQRVLGWQDRPHLEALRTSVAWHLSNPPEQEAGEDWSADDEALAAALP